MSDSSSSDSGLFRAALSACKTLSAGTLCNLLAGFISAVTTKGWGTAVSLLDPTTAAAVVTLAGILGVTEACQAGKDKKTAAKLAEELKTLADRQETAVEFLKEIAAGNIEVKATLDWFEQQELVERIVVALREADLATAQEITKLRGEVKKAHAENRAHHKREDRFLRGIRKSQEALHEKFDQRPSEAALPSDNFAEANVAANRDFVGRREILADLHVRLKTGSVALTHDLPDTGHAAQALLGEGGIGKTQIAIRYAYEHAEDYAGCWWIDASKEAIDISAARLATTLGIPAGPKDPPEKTCSDIRRRLDGGNHLLILDNLEHPERLKDFLLSPPSRVLATTRLGRLPTAYVNELPIDVFQRPESIELLRKHRPNLAGPQHDDDLGRVADHLGNHALAVTLAASYLRKRPSASPAELLERLQSAEVGDKTHPLDKLVPAEHTAGYRRSVYESLSLHLPEFRETPAMFILGLAAFCHPDDIPLELFFDISDDPRETVEEWLAKLADVSIVHYEGKTVSIHRLMQEVIRVEIGEEDRREALTTLVNHLAGQFKDPENYRNWARQDVYAAHAEAAVQHAEHASDVSRAGFLANQLGFYFKNRVRFDSALASYRLAERIDRAALGDDHPNVATRVNNIGSVLKAKGDLDGALKCYREAERINRAAFGDEHPNVATAVNNIGCVLDAKGDLDGALKCYREAERIDRAAFGDDHPNVARDVNNIGGVLQDKGDLDGALNCYRETERIFRAAFGNDHPNVASAVNNIGSVLEAKGDLDGALDCYREAERIDRAAFGDEHPDVARDVNNIGSVLLAGGDREGAGKMMSEAFRILVTTVGPRALNTLTVAENLITLDLDPFALAREVAGEPVANELRQAMAEHAR